MAAIFRSRQSFIISNNGSWICRNDSHDHFPHIEFLLDDIAQILKEILHSKFRLIWGPVDVISDVMNTNLYDYNHNPMIHMCSNDHIVVRFSVTMNHVLIPFINGYKGPIWRLLCDVIEDLFTIKILFRANFGTMVEVELKLCLIFSQFRNCRHCEVATIFFYRKLNIPAR